MGAPVPATYSGPVEYAPQEQVAPDRAAAEVALRGIQGVEGVGEGRNAIGDPAWIAYVRDDSVMARLPRRIGVRDVVPQVSGEIGILPAR